MSKIASILNIHPSIYFIKYPASGNFLAEYMFIRRNTFVVVYRLVPGEPKILVGKQGNREVGDDENEDYAVPFYGF
jgi:hypothetical protein